MLITRILYRRSLVTVICEKVEKSDIATIDKKKYLVPAELTVCHMMLQSE